MKKRKKKSAAWTVYWLASHCRSLLTNTRSIFFRTTKNAICVKARRCPTLVDDRTTATRETEPLFNDTLLTIDFNLKSHIGRVDWTARNLSRRRERRKQKKMIGVRECFTQQHDIWQKKTLERDDGQPIHPPNLLAMVASSSFFRSSKNLVD